MRLQAGAGVRQGDPRERAENTSWVPQGWGLDTMQGLCWKGLQSMARPCAACWKCSTLMAVSQRMVVPGGRQGVER